MMISENFIESIMEDHKLNKAQFKILGQPYPPDKGWEVLMLNKTISDDDANLLIMLKGKLAINAQEKIIKNYQQMLKFNNQDSADMDAIAKEMAIPNSSNSLKIYCDGACLNNPGKAGSGVVIYDGSALPILFYGNYEELGTNNTAELNALYKALLLASEISSSSSIMIFSDSKYSIDCITKWAYGWKSKSWTKKGGEIKNLEIIKLAHALYDDIQNKVDIKHVKGHSGIEGNELADRMAGLSISLKSKDYQEYHYTSIDEVLSLEEG